MRRPSPAPHHPVRAGNLSTYKPLTHQHLPEILETLTAAGAQDVEVRFVPVSAPLVRGIFATAFIEVDATVDELQLAALYDAAFADEPFVRRPKHRLPQVAAVAGSNYVEVGFALGAAARGPPHRRLFLGARQSD